MRWWKRARGAPRHTVDVITRDGCHLCDTMVGVVHRVAADAGLAIEVIDIDERGERDPDFFRRWSTSVPVLLVDGKPVAEYRIDEAQLRRLLR